jgi:hypothetical protein
LGDKERRRDYRFLRWETVILLAGVTLAGGSAYLLNSGHLDNESTSSYLFASTLAGLVLLAVGFYAVADVLFNKALEWVLNHRVLKWVASALLVGFILWAGVVALGALQ